MDITLTNSKGRMDITIPSCPKDLISLQNKAASNLLTPHDMVDVVMAIDMALGLMAILKDKETTIDYAQVAHAG